MGCAASSTVNTADDIKPMFEVGNSDANKSPNIAAESGDLENNGMIHDGDQLEENQNIVEEMNFHNSPAISIPDHQSMVSSSKSSSEVNKESSSGKVEEESNSKTDQNVNSSPNIYQTNTDNENAISKRTSSPSSNKSDKTPENVSRVSSSQRNRNPDLVDDINGRGETQENIDYFEKVYQMVSPRDSVKSLPSSRHSNIVYKPTTSSDDENRVSDRHSAPLNESQEELNNRNKSKSVISESKTIENQPEEFWNQDPNQISNANSLNNIEYEKSSRNSRNSRNSRLSHTYSGSNRSPFFDSLNHGNVTLEADENQNHDEITESNNERVIMGTGDSEQWVGENQNYLAEEPNVSQIKNNNGQTEDTNPVESQITNLSATGDIYSEQPEQTNEETTLNVENNPQKSEANEDSNEGSVEQSLNQSNPLNSEEISNNYCDNSVLITKYLKTAEVNDAKYEGMLIGMNSSPINFKTQQTTDDQPLDKDNLQNEDMNGRIVEIDHTDRNDTDLSENKSPIVKFPDQKDDVINEETSGNSGCI